MTFRFDGIAKELDRAYTRNLDHFWDPCDGSGQVFSLIDMSEGIVRRDMVLFISPLPNGFPPADLSSLGKVDAYLQSE